jgi:hypothetical protein
MPSHCSSRTPIDEQQIRTGATLPRLETVTESPFRMVAEGCGGGDCPTVYERDGDPSYYVQGYNLSDEDSRHISTSAGESVVRIPKSLIAELLKRQS